MLDSYTIQTTMGKKRTFTGRITVATPDSGGDVEIRGVGDCGAEQSLYMRPEEARLLARVLLQAVEEE